MKQTTAQAIMDKGYSVFLTGPAGSGKTHVLKKFISNARREGKLVAVTASTGIAATHLGGNTIHAWSGIGIHDEINDKFINKMSKNRKDQISSVDVLIIDEISMLHDFRLDMIDYICRKVRQENSPFGGLQVVLSGDFYQLPPVNRQDTKTGDLAPFSASWQELNPTICYLSEQHRQSNDMLLELLTALRKNDLRRKHAEALLSRKITRTPFDDQVTELYTTNFDTDKVNHDMLQRMKGSIYEFEMTSTGRKKAIETLKKSCLAPENLQLKKGAFVMFVKNDQNKRYVNGTLGTVVDFDNENGYPIVKTKQGKKINVQLEEWEIHDGETKLASVSQLPIRLAWAITIHKSQGMTLDAAHVDLSNAFIPGMGYVALSRVKSLDSLTLKGINKMALTMNHQAHELDYTFRKKSEKSNQDYSHLAKSYIEKINNLKSRQKNIQNKYPNPKNNKTKNSYKPWMKIEDDTLLLGWADGKTVEQLSRMLGRTKNGIKSRLKKHIAENGISKQKS